MCVCESLLSQIECFPPREAQSGLTRTNFPALELTLWWCAHSVAPTLKLSLMTSPIVIAIQRLMVVLMLVGLTTHMYKSPSFGIGYEIKMSFCCLRPFQTFHIFMEHQYQLSTQNNQYSNLKIYHSWNTVTIFCSNCRFKLIERPHIIVNLCFFKSQKSKQNANFSSNFSFDFLLPHAQEQCK
jgi:hypothetical protein